MITFYRLVIFYLIITVVQGLWATEPSLTQTTVQQSEDFNSTSLTDHPSDSLQNLMTSLTDNDPYTIDNIKVDVTAASAFKARNLAISEAQRQGFIQLINKIVPDQIIDAKTITDADLDFMVQDFEITHEKITAVRYVGDFKIKFSKAAVEKTLARYNIVIASTVQELHDLVIIPLFDESGSYKLWDESNPWFQTWSQGSKEITDNNITIPVGDLDDIKELSVDDIRNGNTKKIAQFVKRYGVHHGLVALLKADKAHDQLSHYTLELLLYSHNDLVASLESTIQPSAAEPRIFFKHLIQKTCELLPQLQAEMNTSQLNQKVHFIVNYASLEQWAKIRSLFNYKPLFKNLHVYSVNRHQAEIDVYCINSLNRMKNHLQAHGYDVQEQSAHHYLLVPSTGNVHSQNSIISNSVNNQQAVNHHSHHEVGARQDINSTSMDTPPSVPTGEGYSPYYMPSEIETSLSAP